MPRTALRALAPIAGVAFAGILTTCTTEASGPGQQGAFAVPVLPANLHLNAFNLTVDNVRLIVVRPFSDTVYDHTTAFPANQNSLQLSADIPLDQGPLTVPFNTSDQTIASLVTTAQPSGAATQTAQVVAGFYYTPFTVAANGVGLQPVAPGTVTVSVSIPSFLSTVNASQSVTVQ